MLRLSERIRQQVLALSVLMMVVMSAGACVHSKTKAGGRAEAEVSLPSKSVPAKSSRAKPELRRPADGSAVDYLSEHSFNWKILESQIRKVKAGLDSRYIVEGFGPFIIASNLPRSRLQDIKENTIRASYNAFYKDYFIEQPRFITTIYIFKNLNDYTHYGRKLFNETRTSPYGYYRSAERSMLINVESGTGTIVHEMAHALMHADFPNIPTWFNEGFASLFEQNRIAKGSISGLTNWRYPILKRAIDTNSVVKLRQLIKTTTDEFYNDEEGYNYAEARYLCFYLQEKGLLRDFYNRFKQTGAYDPSGLRTLEEVLQKDIESIETEWLQWARALQENTRRVGVSSAFRN
jgi:hypothetical protein